MPVAFSKIIVGYKNNSFISNKNEDKGIAYVSGEANNKENANIVKELVPQNWQVTVNDLNCKPLKLCRYSLNDGEWSEVMDVVSVDRKIEHELGIGWRSIFSKQPWMYTGDITKIKAKVKAEFEFDVYNVPPKTCLCGCRIFG